MAAAVGTPPAHHRPGHQAGVGAQRPVSVLPRQRCRLPPGLQNLLGRQQPQLDPARQPLPGGGGQNSQPIRALHNAVSILLPAITVTFSTTAAPSVPLSPILLH